MTQPPVTVRAGTLSLGRRSLGRLSLGLLLLVATAATTRASEETTQPTSRWYEESLDGNKTGFRRVVWAPSTWQGKKTLRDTTTVVSRTQRNMGGVRDTFEVTSTSELERGADGTVWWMRTRVEEPDRVTVDETTWTGAGYKHTTTIVGQEKNRKTVTLEMAEPVMADSEAFLGSRARAGKLAKGDTFDMRQLDLRKRGASVAKLTIAGTEELEDEEGKTITCVKVVERHPDSGSEITLWLDASGAFVQVRIGSFVIRRVTEGKAEAMPSRPAGYSITVPAIPALARIFNADRTLVDVHIRADEHRKLPEFPTSPWSRVLQMKGDAKEGWLAKVELRRYDDQAAKARIPLVDKKFARDLEATALMQTQDPLVRQTVLEVVGDEKDARKAAYKLARFVYTKLANKRSPNVAQADAVQILKLCQGDCSEHCLLFVTLCRAAGIPARRCSGYVCIGSMWGSHAWCEIWTGQWIGADPTTGEVGTGARYIFYGYPDRAGSFPGEVSSRSRGRLRLVFTRVEEGRAAFDLSDPNGHRIADPKGKRFVHALAGVEARDVPADWRVRLSRDNVMMLQGPGFSAEVGAWGDQGENMDTVGRFVRGQKTTFAGVPALLRKSGTNRMYWIFSRRRRIRVLVGGADDQVLAQLERVLAPTFADPAPAWAPDAKETPAKDAAPKDGEPKQEPAKPGR